MKSRRGAFLVLFIPVALVLVSALVFVLTWGRNARERDRSQTVADAVVLSSMRMRASATRTIVSRWEAAGADFGAVMGEQEVHLPASRRAAVERAMEDLRRSLAGHKGRIRSVITVVAEAQGVSRAKVSVTDDAAADLGIHVEPLWVRDEAGNRARLENGWLRRTWTVNADKDPSGSLGRSVTVEPNALPDPLGLSASGARSFAGSAGAALSWPVTDGVRRGPASGFPSTWAEAAAGGRLDPYHHAYWRAVLQPEARQ